MATTEMTFSAKILNSIVGIANRTHRPTQTGMTPKIPLRQSNYRHICQISTQIGLPITNHVQELRHSLEQSFA